MSDTTRKYRVNHSQFILLIGPGDTVSIIDTSREDAVVASGLTEGEAFDWLVSALGLTRPYLPVTRV